MSMYCGPPQNPPENPRPESRDVWEVEPQAQLERQLARRLQGQMLGVRKLQVQKLVPRAWTPERPEELA